MVTKSAVYRTAFMMLRTYMRAVSSILSMLFIFDRAFSIQFIRMRPTM